VSRFPFHIYHFPHQNPNGRKTLRACRPPGETDGDCRPAHPVRRETRARTPDDARGLPEPREETLWEGEREKEQGKSNRWGLPSHPLFILPDFDL